MSVSITRALAISAACLTLLAGCETTSSSTMTSSTLSDPLAPAAGPQPPSGESDVTNTVPGGPGTSGASPEMLGADPNDDLSVAKKYFRQGGFGLAERYFRRAVELHPKNAEAWVGLAASYDRLRRFDLADRAYQQAIKLIGPTPEILNNQGYSFMLRGDYKRARATLFAAKAKSPDNPYIKNNLELLSESERKARTVN